MAQLFTNNASTRLVGNISNVALSLTVTTGHGAKFPNPTGGDFFLVTLSKFSGGEETSIEIVRVTARAGDVFTIVRAQESTTGLAYLNDDYVQLRMTAATSTTVEAHVNSVANPHSTTKSQVGLGNVDNTTDVGKPISTATQTALDLKAPLASPAFTGTPTGLTKAHVGLSNVDNTTDAGKPVSTLQATADALVASNAATDATNKANAAAAASVPIAHAGAGGTAHANVVAAGAAGFMTGADKTKLDGVATGANLYTHPTGDGNLHVPANSTSNNGNVLTATGTAGVYNWATPTQLASTAPANLAGSATVGVGTTTARADHVHAFPTAANVGAAPSSHVGTGGAEHPVVVAAGASGFMTGADKTKLDGVATGANNYSLPIATSGVIGGVRNGTNISIDGSGIISVANVNIGQGTNTSTAVLLTSSMGTGTTIAAATGSIAGVMTGADKTKLDTITGTNTGDQTIGSLGAVGAVGSDGTVTRQMFKDCGYSYFDSTTTNALDYVNGSMQRWAPNTGAQSLTITNWPPTGNMGELLIQGVNLGAATITWPTINWVKSDGTFTTTFSANGVTLQSSGMDFVYLWTRDAGTTIYGKVVR